MGCDCPVEWTGQQLVKFSRSSGPLFCLGQRECAAAGICVEGVPRACGLAAARSVCVRGGYMALHDLSGQWHHRDAGQPGWAGLPPAQNLHRPVLRRLRELQTLSRWGSGLCTVPCQAISLLCKHDWGWVKPSLLDKYHANPVACSWRWLLLCL